MTETASVPMPNAAAAASDHLDREKFRRAKQQVEAIKGFYAHLAAFVLVLAILLAVNWGIGGPWWVQWVFLGWGIGVLAHAFAVYGRAPNVLADWERRKMRKLMDER